jgi:tetratricopeptide (TPR) repeat protein
MTEQRLHLYARAALCYEQAGLPTEAARCRERADEPVAAAELYRTAGDLTRAAACYRRANRIADAADCLIALGRADAAAELWAETGDLLAAGWVMAVDAGQPQKALDLLNRATVTGPGRQLRLRLAVALCGALEQQRQPLVAVLRSVEEKLSTITPASEQLRLVRCAVQAADQIDRADLAAQIYAAAYRCRVPGVIGPWRDWARHALGGTAGIPEQVA